MSGRDTVACGRACVAQAQQALPPYPDSYIIMIVKQHPYRRCRRTGADSGGTGLELATGRLETWLTLNVGFVQMTIQTLEMQKAALQTMGAAGKST